MKNTIHEEYDIKGNLIATMFRERQLIKTSVGEFVPSCEGDYSVRKKYRNAAEFYEDGQIYSIYLNEQSIALTPAGELPAELITFYPDGAVKRLFPLYGQISAYWSEDDEFELSRELEIPVGKKKIRCHPRCIYFYPSGKVRSITIWSKSEMSFATRYGVVKTDVGASFYESGELESIEPTADTAIHIDGKKTWIFSPLSNRIHADNCSLKFDENGKLKRRRKIMRKEYVRKAIGIVSALALVVSAAGCGSQSQAKESSDPGAAKVRIGVNVSVSGKNSYLDEDDKLTGSTVELMRLVDEKLPEYEFELVPTSFDDVFVGLDTGNYQGGEANCFLTAERIEKYAIPKENICASYIGILVKKDKADLTDFSKVAQAQKEKGYTFYPMQAGNGLTYPVEVYNQQNPDNQIVFDYSSENTNNDVLAWIPTGRYDIGLCLYATWLNSFVAEDGAYHEYEDELEWIPVQIVGVYNLFDKNAVSQEFLDKYDAALKEIKADGTASKVSTEFFGYDVFDSDIDNLTD